MSDFFQQIYPGQNRLREEPQLNEQAAQNIQQVQEAGAERAQQMYAEGFRLPITDIENDIINDSLVSVAENGGNIDEARYKMASAMHYSRLFRIPVENAVENFEALNRYYLGTTGTPAKTNWEAVKSAWKAGTLMLDFNQAARAWKNSGGMDKEAEARADELYQQMEGLEDSIPRPWYIELLKAGAQSAPFTLDVMAAALAGNTTGTAGAILAGAGAGVIVGTGGLAAIPMAIIGAFGTAAGMAMGLRQSVLDQEGAEYYRMRRLGVDHDIASPVSSIGANLLGLVEVGLGNVPGLITSIGGGAAAKTVTGAIMKRIGVKNILGPVARAAANYVGQGIEEGLEEGVQQFISNASDIIATELQGAGATKQQIDHLLEGIGENVKQGIMASIMMGIPGSMVNYRGNVQEAKNLNRMASSLDLEDFIDFAKRAEPEVIQGLTESDKTTVLTKIWESQQARQERRERQAPVQPGTEEQLEMVESEERPGKRAAAAEVKRLESGRLYATDEITLGETEEGITEGRLLVGDPTAGSGKRYGFINYSEDENTVTIQDLKTSPGYQAIRRDMVLELAANKPGKEIVWNPKSKALQQIKNNLQKYNPRGEEAGLQWFETEKSIGDLVRISDVKRRLTEVAPQIRPELQEGFISLISPIAKARGQSLDEFMGDVFAPEVFTKAPTNLSAAQGSSLAAKFKGKRGGTTFQQVAGKYRALVYLTETSDFSTLAHEFMHGMEPHLSATDRNTIKEVYGENREGLPEDFERYLYNGEAPTPELANLFQRVAEWFREVYRKISGVTEVDPRIKDVFDRLFTGESARAEQEATQRRERTAEQAKQVMDAANTPQVAAAEKIFGTRLQGIASYLESIGQEPVRISQIQENLADVATMFAMKGKTFTEFSVNIGELLNELNNILPSDRTAEVTNILYELSRMSDLQYKMSPGTNPGYFISLTRPLSESVAQGENEEETLFSEYRKIRREQMEKELREKERSVVNPIDTDVTAEEKADQLQALTKENKPIIDGLIKKIDSALGTESKWSEKEKEKIIEKASRPSIISKKPWHGVEHIRDSFRFKTVVSSLADIKKAFDFVLDEGIEVVKIDTKKLFYPKMWGWRFVGFDMRMPNGQLVEWYLPLKELEGVKKINHLIFEKWRNRSEEEISKSPDLIAEHERDVEESFNRYNSAWNKALEREGYSDETAARAAWASLEAEIGSSILSKFSKESSASTTPERQTPFSRTAANPPSMTRTRPSAGSTETITTEPPLQSISQTGIENNSLFLYQAAAWHGGATQFSRFSAEYIGTGEGHAAFGWGLYFTEAEDIARDYASAISTERFNGPLFNDPELQNAMEEMFGEDSQTWIHSVLAKGEEDRLLDTLDMKIETHRARVENYESFPAATDVTDNVLEYEKQLLKDSERLKAAIENKEYNLPQRIVYRTRLFSNKVEGRDYQWLDWYEEVPDGLLERLSQDLRDKLDALYIRSTSTELSEAENNFASAQHKMYRYYQEAILNAIEIKEMTGTLNGGDLYERLSDATGKKDASLYLLSQGIDGIRYPSGTLSDIEDSPYKNYVVFDDSQVEIEEQIVFQRTDTEQFKRWFKDSKIVDDNGEPLVVYHGTRSSTPIESFDSNMIGRSGYSFMEQSNRGYYFTSRTDPGYGETSVLPVYLSIKNPYVLSPLEIDGMPDNGTLKEEGYDGIIIKYVEAVEYIAFFPEQIKSVYNKGTFDPAREEMLYQQAWHGTGKDFDKLSTAYVGSGRGKASKGWGIYASSEENIARWFADILGGGEGRRHVYKLNVWSDKDPVLLDYYHPVDETIAKKIIQQAKKENWPAEDLRKLQQEIEYSKMDKKDPRRDILKEPTFRSGMGGGIYERIENILAPEYASHGAMSLQRTRNAGKLASEFLVRAGVDGMAFPTGNWGEYEGDKRNYVIYNAKEAQIEEHILFQSAAHGSGEAFDAFKAEFIGSGEGNQAFGWGFYVSDTEEIARQYAESLGDIYLTDLSVSGVEVEKGGKAAEYGPGTGTAKEFARAAFIQDIQLSEYTLKEEHAEGGKKRVLSFLRESLQQLAQEYRNESIENPDDIFSGQVADELVKMIPESVDDIVFEFESTRNLYRVDVWSGRDPVLIDWYNEVDEMIGRRIVDQAQAEEWSEELIEELNDALGFSEAYFGQPGTGDSIYGYLASVLTPKEASLFLLRAGIDGIRYPTGTLSGYQDSDSYNYVVFDEEAIKIEERIVFQSSPTMIGEARKLKKTRAKEHKEWLRDRIQARAEKDPHMQKFYDKLIASMTRRYEKDELALSHIIAGNNLFTHRDGRKAIIHASPRKEYKWQLSYFDGKGPYGHQSENSLKGILDMLAYGSWYPDASNEIHFQGSPTDSVLGRPLIQHEIAMGWNYQLPGDSDRLQQAIDSPDFKRFFEGSKVVDENGDPQIMYHATTHPIDAFDPSKANPENDMGKGVYLTSSIEDAEANYEGEGPDLRSRIQQLAERLEQDMDLDEDEALRRAREQLNGGYEQTIPLYAAIKNPVIIGGDNETFFDYRENRDPETGEVFDEETGLLTEFISALRTNAYYFYPGSDMDITIPEIYEAAMGEGLGAADLLSILDSSEGMMFAEDEEGNLANKELIRQTFEELGFDGIIDRTVFEKFGPRVVNVTSSLNYKTEGMQGVDEDTFHVIAFYPNQLKSVNNRGEWNPEDDRILFQSEEELMEEARDFDDWKEWRDFHEALTPPGEMTAEERAADDEWYKRMFKQAQKQQAAQATPDELDNQFLEDMADLGALTEFLDEMAFYLEERERFQPLDAEEQAELERMEKLGTTISAEVHPTIYNNALHVSRGRALNPSVRKAILTLMSQAPRAYRALYSEIMQNDRYAVPEGEETVLPEIERPKEPATTRMSITERLALARRIQNEDIAKRLRSGELVVEEEINQYVESLQDEKKSLQKKIDELQESVSRGDQVIRNLDRKSQNMEAELEAAEKEHRKLERQVRDLEDRNRTVSERLKSQREAARIRLDEVKARLEKKATGKVILERALAKQQLENYKEEVREKERERKRIQKVRQYKQKLAKRIMKKPSKTIAWEERAKILAIQDRFDPNFRKMKPGEEGVIEAIRQAIKEDREYESFATPRLLAMATKRNLSNMSLEDVESTARFIDSLARYGRAKRQIWKFQRDAATAQARDAIVQQIEQSGRYSEPPAAESAEAARERRGLKGFLRNFDYSFINLARKAIMLDNGKEGINYRWLITEERRHRRDKLAKIRERNEKVMKALDSLGIKITDLYRQHEVSSVGPGDSAATYTTSDLMYVLAGTKNEKSRLAIAYGNLVSAEEKKNFSEEELIKIGERRLTRLQQFAERALSLSEKQIISLIEDDYSENFDRLNNAAIEEFNMPVERQNNYVPIKRKEMTYEDLRAAVADDLLNLNAGGLQRLPKRGMIQKRQNIRPKYQKPTELDLFGGWNKAVETQEHFINYTGYVRELNGIYKRTSDPQNVRGMIVGAYGHEMMDHIDDAITEFANPAAFVQRDNASRFLRGLRGDLGAAYLGWKLSSIVTQVVTSPMPFLGYVNPVHLTTSYLRVLTNPIKAWNNVAEKSDIMRTRSIDPIFAAIKQGQKDQPGKKINKIKELGMKGMEWADRISVVAGWIALYEQQLKKNGGDETAAIEYADKIVLRTQPSGQAEDLAPAFKTKQEAWRVFLQFQSQLNIIWQNIRFDLPTALKNRQFGRALGIAYSYMIAGALLGLTKEGFKDDDEPRDKALNMLYWSMTQFSDAIPLLGSAFTSVIKGAVTGDADPFFSTKIYPAANTMMEGFRRLTKKDFAKALENFGYSAGYFIGAPVSGYKDIKRAIDSDTAGEAFGKLVGRRE